MYETKKQRPLARARFVRRLLAHLVVAIGLLVVSLAFGIWGYVFFEKLAWRDAFLNAAMLLGGMGPVNPPGTVIHTNTASRPAQVPLGRQDLSPHDFAAKRHKKHKMVFVTFVWFVPLCGSDAH
jgi:hypothetical protein